MVVNFEVGKTYVYNGKIGDPSPFVGIGIGERDALFMVSGKPLVCTDVENKSCPFIKFDGMSSPRGWALNSRYHLFDEVEKKTVVKETQKEEKKEITKFEVGKTYRYNGKIGDPSPFVSHYIDKQDALFIVSGEPLVCIYAGAETDFGTHVGFKGMRNEHGGWSFTSLYHLFDEVVDDKYVPVKKFETGKWYVCHLNKRPSTWNVDGKMDGLLDGKPHKCIMGDETLAEFEDIPLRGVVGWNFRHTINYFEEVTPPVHGEPVISPDQEYIARQLEWIARNGVKAGTKVRVTRTAESDEDGWDNSWVSSMDKNIGKTGTVDCGIGTMHGLYIDFGDEACREYPFFVLEVVDDTHAPVPSSEVDWEKKYAELEKRYNKLKGMFVEYLMDEEVEFDKLQ